MPEEDISPQPQDETIDEVQDVEATEAPEETQTLEQPAEVETTEAPVEEVEEEDDSYNPFELDARVPQFELPQLDVSQLRVDADGNADVNDLAQLINQHQSQVAAATQAALQQSNALVSELEEKRREELLWQKATEKYPELKDKEYAKDVQAFRFGKFNMDLENGNAKLMSPAQAAASFAKRFGQVKADTYKQAAENVRVQESAYIEPTSGKASSSSTAQDNLIDRMRSSDRAEAEAASQAWIKAKLFGE